MSSIESRLTTAVQNGTWLEFGQSKEDSVPTAAWDSDRSVSASAIMEICLSRNLQIHPKGIRIRGARITGTIDLTGLTLPTPLRLEQCWLDESLLLNDFVGTTVSLAGSRVPGVNAERILLKNGLTIRDGFICDGEFNLRDATISGSIEATSATFRNLKGYAFTGTRLKMGGGIYFKDVHWQGELRLVDAQLGGSLNCQGGDAFNPPDASNPDRRVIDATRASIKGAVYLNKDFRSKKSDEKGFSAKGQINLFQTQIGGTLELGAANIENTKEPVLNAVGISVRGAVLLNKNFQSRGLINFSYGTIGGTVECDHSAMQNPGETVFLAIGCNIAATLIFGDRDPPPKPAEPLRDFRIDGAINLRAANIGELTCRKGHYVHAKKDLLDVTGAVIRYGIFVQPGAQIEGGIRVAAARIGVNLDINGLVSCKGCSAINAESLQVGNDLSISNADIAGEINLRNAKVGRFIYGRKNWQAENSFLLENFEYRTFSEMPATDRLAWLRSQKPWSIQPYEQAAKTLRLLGFTGEARIVGRAQKNDMRKYGRLTPNAKFWNKFLDWSIGHGYQIWRLAWYALAIIVLGGAIFWRADCTNSMLLIKTEGHPGFNAFVYSADVFLPAVNLHQKEYWLPDTQDGGNCLYMVWLWFETCLGWIATTLALAGLTSIVKKE